MSSSLSDVSTAVQFQIQTLFYQQKIISRKLVQKVEKTSLQLLMDVVCPSFIFSKRLVGRCSNAHREFASISNEQGHFSLSKHCSHCYIGEITITDHLALACSLVQIWSWTCLWWHRKMLNGLVLWLQAVLMVFNHTGSFILTWGYGALFNCVWLQHSAQYQYQHQYQYYIPLPISVTNH